MGLLLFIAILPACCVQMKLLLLFVVIVPIFCEWDFVGLWGADKKPKEPPQNDVPNAEPENGDSLLTSGAFENYYIPMLNDKARNQAFRKAIEKAVKKEHIVLDIGAGQGLLSMMAARAGKNLLHLISLRSIQGLWC